MAREGRYPSGSYLPTLSRGFAAFERGDFFAAIEVLAPLAAENERIGGSRAQHDLIEFTLLKASLEAARAEEAQRLLSARRPGASGVPCRGARLGAVSEHAYSAVAEYVSFDWISRLRPQCLHLVSRFVRREQE